MQTGLLIFQECFERVLEFFAKIWNGADKNDSLVDQRLVEGNDDKDFLNMHFYHSFADQCGTEECPERYEEMAASYTRQIEQRIGNLKKTLDIQLDICACDS